MSGKSEMERALTLISHHLCPYVQRAAIALAEKEVPFERVWIDLAAKPDWFTKISPLGKVPVLSVRRADGSEVSIFVRGHPGVSRRDLPLAAASGRSARAGTASRLDRVRLGRAQRHL